MTRPLHGRDARATLADDYKRQLATLRLAIERCLNVIDHSCRRRRNNRDRGFPKLAITRGGDERFFMRLRQWFQAYMLTFECDWRDFHGSSFSLLRFVPFQVATTEHAGKILAQQKSFLYQVQRPLGIETQVLCF